MVAARAFSTLALVWASLAASALGAKYAQSDSHQGSGFLKSFDHMAISDPTHGRVSVSLPPLSPHPP